MLKSCGRCGGIHDANYTCYRGGKYLKQDTAASKFRNTKKWANKSKDIRDRDKHLCRICIANIYNTNIIYNFNKLEVHHIVPINEDYNKRLDDDNLITLCCYHHKLADNNEISRPILVLLTNPNCNLLDIKSKVEGKGIPPTF